MWRLNSTPLQFKFHKRLRKHNSLLRFQKSHSEKSKPPWPSNGQRWKQMVCTRNNCSFSLEPLEEEVSMDERAFSALLVPELAFGRSYLRAGTEAWRQGLGTLKEASSSQLGSRTSLLISGLLAAELCTAGSTSPAEMEKKKKQPHIQTRVANRAPESTLLIHASGLAPCLLPTPGPGHS